MKQNKIKKKSIRNIAQKSFYYSWKNENNKQDISFELFFQRLETAVSPIIKKIDDFCNTFLNATPNQLVYQPPIISESEKIILLEFLITMISRVPAMMDKSYNQLKDIWKDSIGDELTKKYDHLIKEAAIKASLSIGTFNEYDFLSLFLSRQMCICYIKSENTSFITTDNPVVKFRNSGPDGLKFDDTELWLPLSQRCLLMLTGKNDGNVTYQKVVGKQLISRVNRHIASKSKDIIVCRDRELLESIVKKVF